MDADNMQAKLTAVLSESGNYEPPVLPEVARAVVEATRDAQCQPKGVAEILRRDAALAAGVLRCANSPAYAPRSPIVSLPQAISRLGFDAIRRIAVLVACDERVFFAKGHEKAARALYSHSTLTAFVAQEIARGLKVSVEDAFIGGLLHDIGKSITLQALSRMEAGKLLCDAEEAYRIADALHESVGARALTSWGLPPRSLAAVAHHHRPFGAPEGDRGLACIVSIADELAHAFEDDAPVDVTRLAERMEYVSLYEDDVHELWGRRATLLEWARGV